jgi:hypothetical protein
MSEDDSPIPKRGGRLRGNHPIIQESQESSSQPAKLPVPPSPGASSALELQESSSQPAKLPVPPSPGASSALESQRSPSQPAKMPVPPSPGASSAQDDVAIRFQRRWDRAVEIERMSRHPLKPKPKKPQKPKNLTKSKRQQMLDNPLIAHQAKEGKEGSSVEGSENSEDDR